ncbi:hypothetical protein RR48_09316 [Papilio machaon]|uniref:Uncharacterized protein n=1 Tax=Papilio machaon TaxID=76193 RepID=A0A194RCU4_PAPMA|nr:hypothetical protein RR48_09316 [Papilio machaon]
MLRGLLIICLVSIVTECNGDLSFFTAIPKAVSNSAGTFFGTFFGGNAASPANAQEQKNYVDAPPVKDVSQKVADKQGDENFNQNVNLNNNKGALNLSSYGKNTDSNYGNYEQVARQN